MDGGHTVEVDAAGDRPTVRKRGRGAAGRRLRVEGAALAAARHPGVVALADGGPIVDDDGTVSLSTHFAGSRTLATVGPLEPSTAAALIASLAATVADLHDLGVVHRRLTPDHVVIATDGRPVLCGLADAARVSRPGPATAEDVAHLGALLRDLVAAAPAELEEPPGRRLARRRSSSHLRGALLNLADQATADAWQHRPTARQLASAISSTAPGAALPHAPTARPTSPGPPRTPSARAGLGVRRRRGERPPEGEDLVAPPPAGRPLRRPGPLTVGALAAVAVVGVAVPFAAGGADGEPRAVDVTAADTTATSTTSTTAPPATTTIPPPTPALRRAAGCAVASGAPGGATADGAPCPTPLALDGGRLLIDDLVFDLGVDPAAAALGDFTCRGRMELAVVDLTDGTVAVFDRWARPGAPVDGHTVATIDAPRQIVAEPHSTACHRLAVLDTWGLRHVVALEEAGPGATVLPYHDTDPTEDEP